MESIERIDVQALRDQLMALVSEWGLSVVGAIAFLVVGWLIAKTARMTVRRGLERSKLDPTVIPFLGSFVYYSIVAAVIIAVLNLFGVPTTSFVAVLGAAGLAIGLALQGTLSNFAAGVMLLVFRPFRVGDYVEVAGVDGKTEEISVFTTTLNTFDNVRLILPNASVWGSTIKNYTCNELRRNDIEFAISYGDDIATAKQIILRSLEAEPRVKRDPEPLIAVRSLGDSSVNILVGAWCDPADYWRLRFDLIETIKVELEEGGCTIPFPQRDVHIHNTSE
jgi:small conductance mechanosensitive channel